MISQRNLQLQYRCMISSHGASTRNPVESITCSPGDPPTQAHISDFQPRALRQLAEKWTVPGVSRSCHQTQTAWPQPVAGLKKKMLKQSRKYFSMTPVNLSAQSTEQQVYTMQDQRYFELKLIRLCQRVQVNITGISVHLVEICSAGRMKTFYLQHQFQLNCRAYSYLIRGRFDSQEGNPGYQHDTQVQVSLIFCLACPSVSWDSIMISIPTP